MEARRGFFKIRRISSSSSNSTPSSKTPSSSTRTSSSSSSSSSRSTSTQQQPPQASASTPAENQQWQYEQEQHFEARQHLYEEQARAAAEEEQAQASVAETSPDWGGEDDAHGDTTESAQSSGDEQQDRDQQQQRQQPPQAGASTHGEKFRRQGLPCRVLVDRMGDLYKHVGGQSMALAEVAGILKERRLAMTQARASTPSVVRRRGHTALCRSLQMEVMETLFTQWVEDYGSPYRDRILEAKKARTEPQMRRALQGYFRTHCDNVFGGQLWFKFLVAIRCVPPAAAHAANDVIHLRTHARRQQWASDQARAADSHHFLRRDARPVRASTPDVRGEAHAAAGDSEVVHPRAMRHEARREKKQLQRWGAASAWEFEQRMKVIQEKLDAADEASERHGFPHKNQHGQWRLVDKHTPASLFEEALLRTLAELGFASEEAKEITSEPTGRTSTSAKRGGPTGASGWGSRWDAGGWGSSWDAGGWDSRRRWL